MEIRPALPSDAAALAEIYRPYVEETAVTFAYEAPTAAQFSRQIAAVSEHYPYLVLLEGDTVLGYACAGPFKDRAAYDWAVETTIYLRRDRRFRGLGRILLSALEDALRSRGFLNAYACIAYTEQEDETLTNDSRRFHERMGYRLCGTFRQCGYKFGRWYDMIWMEKMLGSHGPEPLPPRGE